jgi:DNA polymerase-3 subunit beta
LTTSDGNLSIKSTIHTNEETIVIEGGEILIPCKLFLETIKKQIGTQIIIEEKENILFITSKNSSITINLLNIEDYPRINFELSGKEFKIKNKELKSITYDVSFASGENNKKLILNGINISIDNRILIASATNSYRLATKKIIVNNEEKIDFTLFPKNLRKFILDDSEEELKFIIDDQKINLETKNTIIQSKLLEGEYPKISTFIPTTFDYELKIDVDTFRELIERTTVIDKSQSASLKMQIISEDKKLIINSRKKEIGSVQIEYNNIN